MKSALSVVLAVFGLLAAPAARGADDGALTDAQRRAYAHATKARDEAEKPLLERQRTSLGRVRTMIADGVTGRAFDRELDALRDVAGEIHAAEARYSDSLAKVLTPAQRARLAAAAAAAPAAGVASAQAPAGAPGDEEEQE